MDDDDTHAATRKTAFGGSGTFGYRCPVRRHVSRCRRTPTPVGRERTPGSPTSVPRRCYLPIASVRPGWSGRSIAGGDRAAAPQPNCSPPPTRAVRDARSRPPPTASGRAPGDGHHRFLIAKGRQMNADLARLTTPASPSNQVRAGVFGPIRDRTMPAAMHLAIWIISVAAFVFYAVESVLRQQQFKTSIDITIFQQAIANYAQGRAPDVLIKSQQPFNILGDHFSPIMMVLAPFYRLWPSVYTLLIAQALLLAVGVHVVTRIGVRRLGGLGYYLGVSFALSWGVLKVVDFDFHEACFAVAFLALALEALIDERPGWMLGWCAALILVKEDTPLFIAGIALVFAACRRPRWAAGSLAGSVLCFLLLTLLVIPALSYWGTYTYFDLGGSTSGPWAVGGTVLSNVFS